MNITLRDLETKAIKYEELAKYYRAVFEDLKTTDNGSLKSTPPKPLKKPSNGKQTLSQIVDEALSGGIPKTTRDLYNLYIKITGNTKLKYTNFSGRVSNLKNVRKFEIPENPIETRYYNCLDDWFIGFNLKDEYLNKIS